MTRSTWRLLLLLCVLAACTPSGDTVPSATAVPIKRLATIALSLTPDDAARDATLRAAPLSTAAPTPTLVPTPTVYIGIFLGSR
ncbi:MAG: hypothetical protein SGJ24_13895 [Chloroflexota bacterium]|nr:hypothetical protein [Chloroflexota bacterium]